MEEKKKFRIKIKKKIQSQQIETSQPGETFDSNISLDSSSDNSVSSEAINRESITTRKDFHKRDNFKSGRYVRHKVESSYSFKEGEGERNTTLELGSLTRERRDERYFGRGGFQESRDNKQVQGMERRFSAKDKTQSQLTTSKTLVQKPTMLKRRILRHPKKEVENLEVAEKSFESKLDSELTRLQKKKVYAVPEEIEIYDVITVGDLAKKMNVRAADLIETLEKLGLSVTINDRIDSDTAIVVAEEFGTKVVVKSVFDEINVPEEPDDPKNLRERTPVVTVMGHVDHGKTTLLDAIRNTRVAQSEAGGITQHIGASVVEVNGKKITFIDTPGHEAFTAMRMKGAKVTDIVVLVVAADDGVKEQTVEALNHARDAKVPIIVAINKIDVPGSNPDRVKNQLSEMGLVPEEWGGDTMYVEVSALKKLNIDKLLEAILLQAEVMDLKADFKKRGVGFVIESKVEQGRGIVFTVIPKNGVIRVGDNFVVGTTYGKVRAIFDDKGNRINELLPGLPGEIVGADELPSAGDKLNVVESEDIARSISEKRRYYSKIENAKSLKSIKNPFEEVKEIKYIVKGDVFGSVEAIKYSLEKLSTDETIIKVIHYGVGQVNESDVMLASAGGASIIAFRTKVGSRASEIAERERVKIRKYNIIYEIIEDVRKEIEGMKEPRFVEKVLGIAEVKKIFRISGVGTVAGCYVKEGVIQRKAKVRIYRDNSLVFDGQILSLKHFKDDVSEIKAGLECGISFKDFEDVKEGDTIECYDIFKED